MPHRLSKRVDKKRRTMASIAQLVQLSSDLDSILRFDYGDDDEQKKNSILSTGTKVGALGAAAGTAGAAGLYGLGATKGLGLTGGQAVKSLGTDLSRVGRGGLSDAASTIARGASVAKAGGQSALSMLLKKIQGVVRASSKENAIEFEYSPPHIKAKNKGKFDATKKKTGESTEELEHSKNPKTRKRAVFAANAAKWNHSGRKNLSAKLDSIINFEFYNEEEDKKNGHGGLIAGGAGLAGAGATGYGLYRKGLKVPAFQGRKGASLPTGATLKPGERGVMANIGAGARDIQNKIGVSAGLLAQPGAREAIGHDLRSTLAKKIADLSKRIKPE